MRLPYGQHHFAVHADSDIQDLDEVEGATVSRGPRGVGADNGAGGCIEATTSFVAGEDCEAVKASGQTGTRRFLTARPTST
ncbi:MAG: hypothetical protein OXF88_22625 [Rhodobacteraceae bacterium]|nr:hypothetical protein [Paracoccaceae bacterium]